MRIVIATCGNYMLGDLKHMRDTKEPLPDGKEYATSKLALMVFATAFQKHLNTYQRPDKAPNNARVVVVDPGPSRTPGMRRWLSFGTVWGLLGYVLMWPLYWLVLPSASGGAQAFLWATLEADFGRGQGGRMVRGTQEVKPARPEVGSDQVAEELWKFSEAQITALEKEGATQRAVAKKEAEGGDNGKAKRTRKK